MTQSKTVGLVQFIREALEARIAEINVSLPCKVLKYDSAKNTVNLQPLLKRRRRKKDNTVVASEIPTLQNVPVAFQRVNGAWITLPVTAGDVGMVTFAQRSLGQWMKKAKGSVVEPTDETMHPLAGAWFYPGGYPGESPIDSPSTDHPVFHTETELHLGEKGLSADQYAAVGKLVDDRLDSFRTSYNSHQHPETGGTTGPPAVLIAVPFATVKATKVKIK